MLVNPIVFVVGIGAYVAFAAWIMWDWRVRSVRSAALFVAALIAGIAARLIITGPAGWAVGAVLLLLILTPVLIVHPAVMPLAADDAATSRSLGLVERRVVRAGQRFKAGELSPSAYIEELKASRTALRDTRAPDEEWSALLAEVDEELSSTIANAEGTAKHTDHREQRAAIRTHQLALTRKRLKFWR